MQAFEHELGGRRDARGRLPHLEVGERGPQRGDVGEHLGVLRRGDVFAGVHDQAALERGDDVGELLRPGAGPERLEDRRLHDAVEHLLLATVVDGLELDLARGARHQRVEVADAGHDLGLAVAQGAASGVGDQRLVVGDREPHRHAGPLVDVRGTAGLLAHLGDDLGHERRHLHVEAVGGERARLLLDDRGLELGVERVVRADLRSEAVLQRGDDATAVGVVLGVGRRQEHEVDREAHLVAADLHVALLEHVEQAHLDALGEVGELVDREDRAVGARHEAVVDGELVGEVAALGDLDGVDLADEVGDRRVGRGELLAEAPVAVHPLDRGVVTALGDRARGRGARSGGRGRR